MFGKPKPRWKDKDGNLYSDKEIIQTGDRYHVIGKPTEVIPIKKKFK